MKLLLNTSSKVLLNLHDLVNHSTRVRSIISTDCTALVAEKEVDVVSM